MIRAAKRASRDEEEEKNIESVKSGGSSKSGKVRERKTSSRSKSRRRYGDDDRGNNDHPATAEEILDLRWPLIGNAFDVGVSSDGDEKREDAPREETEGVKADRGEGEASRVEESEKQTLSIRSYVKQRQERKVEEGGVIAEEKKAEELRKTAVLGPVLNDGER